MANGNEQLAARKKAARNTLFQCAKRLALMVRVLWQKDF